MYAFQNPKVLELNSYKVKTKLFFRLFFEKYEGKNSKHPAGHKGPQINYLSNRVPSNLASSSSSTVSSSTVSSSTSSEQAFHSEQDTTYRNIYHQSFTKDTSRNPTNAGISKTTNSPFTAHCQDSYLSRESKYQTGVDTKETMNSDFRRKWKYQVSDNTSETMNGDFRRNWNYQVGDNTTKTINSDFRNISTKHGQHFAKHFSVTKTEEHSSTEIYPPPSVNLSVVKPYVRKRKLETQHYE